jgi:O-antigen ligase
MSVPDKLEAVGSSQSSGILLLLTLVPILSLSLWLRDQDALIFTVNAFRGFSLLCFGLFIGVFTFLSWKGELPAVRLPRTWLIAILLWMFVTLLAATFSQWPQRGLVRQAEWYGWMAACIVMVVASRQWAWWNMAVFILALSGWGYVTIATLLLVMEHGALSNEPWDDQAWVLSVIPGCRHLRHFGYACAFATMTLAVLPLISGSRWWFRHGAWLLWGIAWASVLWCGGRGAFMACLFSTLLLVLLIPKTQRWNYCWSLVFAFLTGLFLSLCFPVGDSFGPTRIFLRDTAAAVEGADAISSGRLSIWLELLDRWSDKPWLGVGPDTVPVILEGGIVQPHSLPVQLLLEWGVIGAGAFLICLGFMLKDRLFFWWDMRKRSDTESGSVQWSFFITWLAVMIGFSFFSLVDGILYHAWPMWLICSIMGWAFPVSSSLGKTHKLICKPHLTLPYFGFITLNLFVLAMGILHYNSGKALQSSSPSTISEIPSITRWFTSFDNEEQRCTWIRSIAKKNLNEGVVFARECANNCSRPWRYLETAAKCAGEQGETTIEQKLLAEANGLAHRKTKN